SHRALLQQAQAVPPRRNPIRQAPRQLHGIRQTRSYRNMAQIVKSSLRPNAFAIAWRTCQGGETMRIRSFLTAAALAALFVLPASAETRTFVDDVGRTVELELPIERAVVFN